MNRAMLILLAGCGRLGFASVDVTGGADGSVAPACTNYGPWSAPLTLTTINTTADDWGPWLSEDKREIWYAANQPGQAVAFDLYHATRPSPGVQFGPRVKALISTTTYDDNPFLTRDGLTLWFDNDEAGAFRLKYASRAQVTSEFLAATTVAELGNDVEGPYVTDDGLTIYYDSIVTTPRRIYEAHRTIPAAMFGAGTAVANLTSTATGECCPTLAPDGSLIYTEYEPTTHPMIAAPDGSGGFQTPVPFDAAVDAADLYLTHDGLDVIYTVSSSSYDLFETTRVCLD